MDFSMDVELGEWRLRTLGVADAPLVVDATSGETGRALWDARPVGPYSLSEARTALEQWQLTAERQVSFGVVADGTLLAALGLMLDGPDSAELAYWVRPESRRQGVASGSMRAFTEWVHDNAGLSRLWLEINPDNLPSQRLARAIGYRLEERRTNHCRSWINDDPARDRWHDCLIWTHVRGRTGDGLA